MKTAIYCVSKNGYKTALKIQEEVYKNSHIFISERVCKLLNLEIENADDFLSDDFEKPQIFKITTRVPILLDKIFNKYNLINLYFNG